MRDELDALSPAVFESALPAQGTHGDASISNLLRTDPGLLWNDLKGVCVGPVHWDVAGLVVDVRGRGGDEGYVAALLVAYGQGLDLVQLQPFAQAHELYGRIWWAWLEQRGRFT